MLGIAAKVARRRRQACGRPGAVKKSIHLRLAVDDPRETAGQKAYPWSIDECSLIPTGIHWRQYPGGSDAEVATLNYRLGYAPWSERPNVRQAAAGHPARNGALDVVNYIKGEPARWPACPISRPSKSRPNIATCSSATPICTSFWSTRPTWRWPSAASAALLRRGPRACHHEDRQRTQL